LVFSPINLWFCQGKFEISSAEVSKEINVEYADAKTSPLTKEDLASFKTLILSYK
jgi:hypothetical protein